MPEVEVDVTYLQLTRPDQLRSVAVSVPPDLTLEEVDDDPERARRLYRAVGDEWCWHDRLTWSLQDWEAWLESEGVRTWVARHRGVTAGYFQLSFVDNAAQIAYFGLLRPFFGRGWGSWLLQEAVKAAWAADPERVWLHTCTLDHPAALSNYLARGFEIFDRQKQLRIIADRDPDVEGAD